jgi:tetratricopeptide (TPR) repeat protein
VHFLGDPRKAEPLIRRAVEIRRSIGASAVTPTVTFNLAGLLLALGRLDEAEELLIETIGAAAGQQEQRIEYDAMMELVEVYIQKGDLERATAQMAKVEAIQDQPRFDDHRRAERDYYIGRLLQARGDQEGARARFEASVSYFERREWKIALHVLALLGLSQAEMALGRTDDARATAEKGLALAESFVEPHAPSYLVGHLLVALGEVHRTAGRTAEARDAFAKAREHLQQTLDADHPATKRSLTEASP